MQGSCWLDALSSALIRDWEPRTSSRSPRPSLCAFAGPLVSIAALTDTSSALLDYCEERENYSIFKMAVLLKTKTCIFVCFGATPGDAVSQRQRFLLSLHSGISWHAGD